MKRQKSGRGDGLCRSLAGLIVASIGEARPGSAGTPQPHPALEARQTHIPGNTQGELLHASASDSLVLHPLCMYVSVGCERGGEEGCSEFNLKDELVGGVW